MKSLCLQFGCLVIFFPPVFKRKYLLNRERFSGRIFRLEIVKYLYLAHFMFCIRGIEIPCIIVLARMCVHGASLESITSTFRTVFRMQNVTVLFSDL